MKVNGTAVTAGGYVDLDQKMLLAMLSSGYEPRELFHNLVGVVDDLFQGQNVEMIENIFRERRGNTGAQKLFKEMVVMNPDIVHVFVRGKQNPNHIILFVFEGAANMGLALSLSRIEAQLLEQEVGAADDA